MSTEEVKSQMRQFLAAQYPADLEKSPAGAPEEVASIEVLAGDLKEKADRLCPFCRRSRLTVVDPIFWRLWTSFQGVLRG